MEGIALHSAQLTDRIALRGVRLRAKAAGMTLKATVEQTFVNLEPRAIEAVYTFPLPENAAVCGFEVVTGDRVLTGVVEEAEKAIDQYEQAIDQGHGAYMVEQERPDVFTARVGNLKPRQAATIRLTYVAPLERVDKQIRIAFPTTIAPRYVTATATDPLEAAIDGEMLNPPHVLHAPYGLNLELEIDLGRKLTGVHSPSHSIRTDWTEGRAAVRLATGVTEMNRDLVLTIDLACEHEPSVQAATDPRGRPDQYLAVTFLPEFDEDELSEPSPTETVFLLDCSGSMQGESIQQAVLALELCLRSLSAGDTFNLCKFGSNFEMMASEPLAYSQATLDRAVRFIHENRDFGGTELHPPLEAIFQTPLRAGKIRQVILLTDGQVSNEPAVIELARRHRRTHRLFTFGIGPACSAFLVKGLARATGGAAEFITAGERIDEKVLRTFGRLTSPPVTDVQIDWGGADVQTLAELPPVFDGDVLTVFGRTQGKLPATIALSCQTPSGSRRWSLAAPRQATNDDGAIATMWARRTIQSLEETNAAALRAQPAEATRGREALVNLSKEYGLLCSFTTFIAVEHRSLEERNNGQPALRRVPVALAKGWGGVEAACGAGTGLPHVLASAAPVMPAAAPMRKRGLADRLKKVLGGGPAQPPMPPSAAPAGMVPRSVAPKSAMPSFDESREQERAATDPLLDLLGLQAADGSFGAAGSDASSVDDFVRREGHDPAVWRRIIESTPPIDMLGADRERVVGTVMALLLLSVKFAGRQASWRRAARKATREFLAAALGQSASAAEAWLDTLRVQFPPAAAK